MHSWDCYFMSMAYFVALKSKDPRTKIGAVIVGPDNEIRSTGFNGLPRGIKETKKRAIAPLKHLLYEHAERNAIYNAARMGIDICGCTMYTPCVPCIDCARAIIQGGIKKLVVHSGWDVTWSKVWLEKIKPSKALLKEAGVRVWDYKDELITDIKGYRDGEEFSPWVPKTSKKR